MNFTIDRQNNSVVAILKDKGIAINNIQDALDLMAEVKHNEGADKLIIGKENLPESFFELKTRFAGEVLQKYTNYGLKLAIVGDFKNIESKSLNDFIVECNRGTSFFYCDTLENALEMLHKN